MMSEGYSSFTIVTSFLFDQIIASPVLSVLFARFERWKEEKLLVLPELLLRC
jgi:hypothetical protein